MITLYRLIRLYQLKVKYRLAFWQFVDSQIKDLIENPEALEKKLLPYLAEVIDKTAQAKKNR